MQYELYGNAILGQMKASDAVNRKFAYLVQLLPGKTAQDLDACLTPHSSGMGYMFDVAYAGTVCKVLGKSIDCTRTITDTTIHFSESVVTCYAEGHPSHVIFGDIMPLWAEIGLDKDLRAILPSNDTDVDSTGLGSLVMLPEFTVTFGGQL